MTEVIILLKTSRGGGANGAAKVRAIVTDLQHFLQMQEVTSTTRMVITITAPGEVKSQWPEANRPLRVASCFKCLSAFNSPVIFMHSSSMGAAIASSSRCLRVLQ